MTKAMIATPIYISPIILLGMLLETSAKDAYPSEADSLGIPLFAYLVFFFPVALYLLSNVERGRLRKPERLLWNSRRHVFSAVSLILSIYPLGLFWLNFLLVGISSHAVATVFGSTVLLAVTFLVRTFAIQPKSPVEQAESRRRWWPH
jgi:hypothetical protein